MTQNSTIITTLEMIKLRRFSDFSFLSLSSIFSNAGGSSNNKPVLDRKLLTPLPIVE
jgi:hypothetical protein